MIAPRPADSLDTLHSFQETPAPSRAAGLRRLTDFAPRSAEYDSTRNFDLPPHEGVCRLSPWLRHRLVLESEAVAAAWSVRGCEATEKFTAEVLWRTYWKGWLQRHPQVWEAYLRHWQRDRHDLSGDRLERDESVLAANSGIDCLDAWVSELVWTGYLHNHARMWLASIWIFTLRLPWTLGTAYFLRHLLDGWDRTVDSVRRCRGPAPRAGSGQPRVARPGVGGLTAGMPPMPSPRPPVQIVWLKRDLRVQDHRPLAEAARNGPVLPLYIAEPGLWAQPDASGRHWDFIRECLGELRADLGAALVIRVGEAVDVLSDLLERLSVAAVWSHEETGNGWTYDRDKAVARLLRARGVPWHELPQHGVVRRLASRDRWSREWERRMAQGLTPAPTLRPAMPDLGPGEIPEGRALGLADDPCPLRQVGGRRAAVTALEGFLTLRGERYHLEMSSPLTAYDACSRLSPHLAWGSLSLREAVQATRLRARQVASLPAAERGTWARALAAFEGRLHWHCHFMQKLESAPRIEHENMQRACDGLRDPEPDPERLAAWCAGRTGFPFVDACMRALGASGWLNFRMRAMLMAFASYQLWLHWREPGLHLARLFTDY